jgi:spermidine synthase
MTRVRLPAVLLCFFLSGFAALLYETVWAREFAFVFGTSDLAVATVLAAYMGGLAAGAGLAGRIATRIRRPVLTYGVLELGIGLSALAVPYAIQASTGLLVARFGGAQALPEAGGFTPALFYLVCSFLIVLFPTALMGATLPLLARYAVERESQIGSRVGLLYATNTAGAVAGTLTAAFLLLPALGLRRTVFAGAAVNLAVFVVAALLARGLPVLPRLEPPGRRRAPTTRDRGALILPVIFCSGVVSFSYEVLWTRLLGHIMGGSVYAFATMLATFLVGIAVGSAVASRLATARDRAAGIFVLAQLGAALLSYAAFSALDALPLLAQRIGAGAAASATAANLALSSVALLPAALCIGATFPLAVRILARREAEAGPASARVFAWNTLGAIVGSVGAGFWWIPALGYAGTLTAAVGANLSLAAAACFLIPRHRLGTLVVVAAAAAGLVLTPPRPPWGLLRASPLAVLPSAGEVAYFGVGRTATVLLLEIGGRWQLRANGLPEAVIQRRGGRPTPHRGAAWLGVLPALARPDARSMLVIGLGGGVAVESVPATLERIDVVELEPEVIAANRAIAGERLRDPLSDPRVHLTLNDARSALLLTERRYDAIVSQPSHPWTSGSAQLYTMEFMKLVQRRLAAGGVFVQWMGLSFVDRELFETILATLQRVFPQVRAYRPLPSEVLLLASDQPIDVESQLPSVFQNAAADLARVGIYGPEDTAAALFLDEPGAAALAEGVRPNTDDDNRLAMRSPQILGAALDSVGADRILASRDPLLEDRGGLDRAAVVQQLLAGYEVPRAARIARATRDPIARETALGYVALARGERHRAAAAFSRALSRDSSALRARAALVRLRRGALLAGDPGAETLAAGLDAGGASVVEGWRREREGGRTEIRTLEGGLAAVPPQHPLYADALRLRAAWRLESSETAQTVAALELLDELIAREGSAEDLVSRARAAGLAGHPRIALLDLTDVAGALEQGRSAQREGEISRVARAALRALHELPEDPAHRATREELRRRFQALLEPEPQPMRRERSRPARRF